MSFREKQPKAQFGPLKLCLFTLGNLYENMNVSTRMGAGFDSNSGDFNQYATAISGSLCYAVIGASVAWPSPTLTKMAAGETPVRLDLTQISWMVSLMFLGHISSPIPTSWLMRAVGAKRTCLYLCVFPAASWTLIFFATTAEHLYLARFLAGLWSGIGTTVIPLFIGEIAGARQRGSLITINNTLQNLGVLFAYAVGPHVTYRQFALACQFITLLFFATFLGVPESPYFLLRRGRTDEAFEALAWLRRGESRGRVEAELSRIGKAVEERRCQRARLKDLFCERANRKAFVISMTYAVLKRATGSGVLQAYTSITLPALSLGGLLDPDSCVLVLGIICFLFSVLSTPLAAAVSRRTLLTVSASGSALTMAAVALWFYLKFKTTVEVDSYSDCVFLSLALYSALFNVALGPVGTSVKGELFPSGPVKGLASSLTTVSVAAAAFLMNKYYLIIAQQVGMYLNFVVFSASCLVGLVFTWTYVPDIHNKSLEEIASILGKRSQYEPFNT